MHASSGTVLLLAILLSSVAAGVSGPDSPEGDPFDVVVVGGTPGGIAAAVTAARLGDRVALIEYHDHLGGMAASGLGKSDIEHREAIGGLWQEFVARIHESYVRTYGPGHPNVKLCRDGYYYEPSVAERIFDGLVAELPRIAVSKGWQLLSAHREGLRLASITIVERRTGRQRILRGGVFVDATYEGDLAAAAGAAYRLGRESRAEFNELHAGVVYMDYENRRFLPGTTGAGDDRLPAYTFRLCLTKDPANSVSLDNPPPGYDRSRYTGYLDDWKAGRFDPPKQMKEGIGYYAPTFGTVLRSLSMADIPNGKLDVNMNPRPLGFPFAEENTGYPTAGWDERERITERIRNLTLGLLWFLQNDPAIPAEHRALARQFNLPKDEFPDNDHFPWQLYVREARRIVGEYTLTENDLISGPDLGRARVQSDSIAAGEYPIDSFPVRKRQPGHDVALEGYILMLENYTRPYQIPYRILVPERIDGLLVPVAASTTHIAFSSIRLEPTWMALGEAAGVAAHLALRQHVRPRAIGIEALQRELLRRGQVLTFFEDVPRAHPHFAALQYFGTKGFFPTYQADPDGSLDKVTLIRWLGLVHANQAARNAAQALPDGPVTRPAAAGIAEALGLLPPQDTGGPITRAEFCGYLFGRE